MSATNAVRQLTSFEVERIRLVLSTYQDGTGMLAAPDGSTLPGWRDFERAVALAVQGEAQESKFVFDVLVPGRPSGVKIGLSCKMRGELARIDRIGRVSMELSNSAGKFWDYLNKLGVNQTTYKKKPTKVGAALIDLVHSWHESASIEQGGNIDLTGSSYLLLSWSRKGLYQLHQFPLELPDPRKLRWHFPSATTSGLRTKARCLRGDDEQGTVIEWYGESGGQLKYYPLVTAAVWQSPIFQLEPLGNAQHGLLSKVKAYFPARWAALER